jgi:hypothetical protein
MDTYRSFFFLVVLEFELWVYTLSHSTALFCDFFFRDGVSRNCLPGLLLIAAS